jgi:hypothetical protein
MKECLIFILMLLGSFLMSYAHEKDIYHQCEINGKAGNAAWGHDFSCNPLK